MKNGNLKQEVVWLLNEKYGGKLTDRAKKDITRLEKGEPVDYVIGHKNFCGCKIDLRYKPLIPRDETEYWVGEAVREVNNNGSGIIFRETLVRPAAHSLRLGKISPKANHAILPANTHEKQLPTRCLKILDVFAGGGCCGVVVLKSIPNSHCDFVDIDGNCLKQIRLNLKLNGIDKKRYRIIKSNVFEKLLNPSFNSRYDLILANPPYIGLGEKSKVQKSVLNFEPKQALFAKSNGLYFIEKFLKQAKNYLAPKGVIYLEFGYNQKKDIEKLLKKFKYQNFEFHKDQFNKWRFVKIS
ncbi:MAG: HemK family protein methyltransferase [bacterium]|nr:HemK family protein methyltransferase [bacterium]